LDEKERYDTTYTTSSYTIMYISYRMGNRSQPVERLGALILERKVVTFMELSEFLERSRATVFRMLRQLDYITSYNKNRTGVTLTSIPDFDRWGLWSYNDFHFSRWGSLNETIQNLVDTSPAGLRPRELAHLLGVRVHNHLSMCVADERVVRNDDFGHPVYLSTSPATRREQYERREQTSPKRAPRERQPLSDQNVIRVLVTVIKHHATTLERLMPALEAEGLHLGEASVMWVLKRYDIEKRGFP